MNNNDSKLDIVMGQGEGQEAIEERIFMGHKITVDSAAPIISHYKVFEEDGMVKVKARIHDNKTPNMPHDWRSVSLKLSEGSQEIPMRWYGENLWDVEFSIALKTESMQLCAIDHAGNHSCLAVE